MHNDPFSREIVDKIVTPALNKLSFDAVGVVTYFDYYRQLANIQWRDPRTNEFMNAKDVNIPRDADGIYRQSIKVGDKIKVGFRQGDHGQPYISMVYTADSTKANFSAKYGASIPKGLGY